MVGPAEHEEAEAAPQRDRNPDDCDAGAKADPDIILRLDRRLDRVAARPSDERWIELRESASTSAALPFAPAQSVTSLTQPPFEALDAATRDSGPLRSAPSPPLGLRGTVITDCTG
jgi:hypothetical protein